MGSRRRCCCATGSTAICLLVDCSPNTVPVVGATIALYSGSTLVASATSGDSGCASFTQTGSYTVKVTIGGSVVYSATETLSGSTITLTLSATEASVVCCGGYAIPESLTATDADGSFAFLYDPSYTYPLWTGGHSVTRTSCSVTTPDDICIVADPSTGPVRVCYQMICHSGENPTFAVQRSWSWVYEQGTFTAIWYQDTSGFDPGEFCITAPPAICGSPLTDTASFSANPSSAAPFVLSGTPTPAVSNATSDPVGGTVVISA